MAMVVMARAMKTMVVIKGAKVTMTKIKMS